MSVVHAPVRWVPLRPKPCDHIVTRVLPPESVLFDSIKGDVHLLNPVASALWQLMDGESSVAELAAELATIFDMPAAVVRADVETVIRELIALGLVHGLDVEPAGEPPSIAQNDPKTRIIMPPPDP